MTVDLAGDKETSGGILPDGEVLMDGGKIVPSGRSIRRGGWSWGWTPSGAPIVGRLTCDQERALNDILTKGEHFVLTVRDDIPYLSDAQARVIRDSISLSKRHQVHTARPVLDAMLQKRRRNRHFAPFRIEDPHFIEWGGNHDLSLNVLDNAINEGVLEVEDVRDAWDEGAGGALSELVALCERIESGDCEVCSEGVDAEYGGKCEESSNRVTFGEDSVVEFSVYDESETELSDSEVGVFDESPGVATVLVRVARRRKRGNNILAPVSLTEAQQHCLTHSPASPDCEVCRRTRKLRAPFARGSASDEFSRGAADGPFLTFDWSCPTTVSTTGCRFMAVIGNVSTGAVWTRGYKTKKNNVEIAVHEARVQWGIDEFPFTLHSDCEGVISCPQVKEYLRNNRGIEWKGVPRDSNTNSRAERAVRKAVEGVRAMMFQSGLAPKCWHLAARAFSTEQARSVGVEPRINTARPVPFGCRGQAILPGRLLFRDKFQTKVVHVMHLGVDERSSGGVHVMFRGAEGRLRQGVCLDRDVVWEPDRFAITRRIRDLDEVATLFDKFESADPVTPYQIACDTCGKWRFTSKQFRDERCDATFVCGDLHMDCDVPEDKRVWTEIGDDEVVECDERESEEIAPAEEEAEPDGPAVLVRAQRCKVAARECITACPEVKGIVDGGNTNIDDDTREALMRLGSYRADKRSVARLNRIAQGERRACKDQSVRVCAIIVKGKDALDKGNPERPRWLDSVGTEVSALLGTDVVRVADVGDVRPEDELLPALIVLSVKPDGRFKSRLVACGNFQAGGGRERLCRRSCPG